MKLLICLLISVSAFILPMHAQQISMTNPNGSATDTITNTTAEGPTVRIADKVKAVSFTLEVTAGTGTVAGKVYLRGGTRSGVYGNNPLDSVTLTTGSQNIVFRVIDPAYQYYQLYVVPTGTQSTFYRAVAYIRKP